MVWKTYSELIEAWCSKYYIKNKCIKAKDWYYTYDDLIELWYDSLKAKGLILLDNSNTDVNTTRQTTEK